MLILTFNDNEEKAIEKVIAALTDEIDLASSPNRVFTQSQIFEAVWSIDSDSCHSSVVNVIYNLRKKIEPDSKTPTYIKTVLGVGYKFNG